MTEENVVKDKKLPFNSWSKEKIEEGRKRCTSRTKQYVDDPRVDWIMPMALKYIKKYLYKLEGADSPEELQKEINQIFGKEVDEDRQFYVHFGDFQDGDTDE